MMEDFMRALVQGPEPESDSTRGAGAFGELLQGLLGGSSMQGEAAQESGWTPQGMSGQGGGLDSGSLLEAIMGGGSAGAQAQPPAGAGGGMGDILGAVLGGGMEEEQPQPSVGAGGGLGDILGAIMGGGLGGGQSQQSAGSGGVLGAILGAIMGGGTMGATSGAQSNPIIGAIVAGLAQKLGLPPQIAQIVVAFAMNALLKRRAAAAAGAQQAMPGQAGPQAEYADLDSLLGKVNRGQTLRQTDLRSTDLVDSLVQQTGLSQRDAAASLAYVFNELGSQYGSSARAEAPSAPKPRGLDGLLDTWD